MVMRILNIKKAPLIVFVLLCLSSLPAYGQELELKLELSRKEYQAFEPIVLTVKLVNKSNGSVALRKDLIAGLSKWLRMRCISDNENQRWTHFYNFEKTPDFISLAPGKHIKNNILVTQCSLIRAYDNKTDIFQYEMEVTYAPVNEEEKKELEEFSFSNHAIAWSGMVAGRSEDFKVILPQTPEEEELQSYIDESQYSDVKRGRGAYELFRSEGRIVDKFENHYIYLQWFWYRNRKRVSKEYGWSPFNINPKSYLLAEVASNFLKHSGRLVEMWGGDPGLRPYVEDLEMYRVIAVGASDPEKAEEMFEEIKRHEPQRDFTIETERKERLIKTLIENDNKIRITNERLRKIEAEKQNKTMQKVTSKPDTSQHESKSPNSNNTTIIEQKDETTHKEDIRGMTESYDKPQESNPLVYISILILGAVGAFVIVTLLRNRRVAGKR